MQTCMADAAQQQCPQCGQDSFDFEDTPIGLVCSCGFVVDDTILVHQRSYDAEGAAPGVYVAAEDDGTKAGTATAAAAIYHQLLSNVAADDDDDYWSNCLEMML